MGVIIGRIKWEGNRLVIIKYEHLLPKLSESARFSDFLSLAFASNSSNIE
jgi:hypothetical protein